MKISQAMAAAILIGGLLTGPAVAGVTGAEGGNGSVTENRTETINETHNVHRVDTYKRADTSSRTDKYVTNTFVNRVYEYDTQTKWAADKTVSTSSSETLEWHGVKHGGWDAQRNPQGNRTVSGAGATRIGNGDIGACGDAGRPRLAAGQHARSAAFAVDRNFRVRADDDRGVGMLDVVE